MTSLVGTQCEHSCLSMIVSGYSGSLMRWSKMVRRWGWWCSRCRTIVSSRGHRRARVAPVENRLRVEGGMSWWWQHGSRGMMPERSVSTERATNYCTPR